jgi:Fe-S-cluster-containing hydrogenase component 2/CRP-like cAMP-binding protein
MQPPVQEDFFQQYESQYVTDLNDTLIRVEDATRADLQTFYTLTIDGQKVENVPKAVPARDDQGNVVRDADGQVKPRLTTVYDAVTWRYRDDPDANFAGPDPKNPVPVLCHQNHMRAIGVCRVCSCLTVKNQRVGEKLIPSCQHPIVNGMEVHTVASTVPVKTPTGKEPEEAGKFLSKSVKVLLELLAANSLHEEQRTSERRYRNELLDLCERFGIPIKSAGDRKVSIGTAFFRRTPDPAKTDNSSRVIKVDHNNCILCDRCVRGCSEVKPFTIVGHTGFGNKARISFDLGAPMGESNCVSCGECTVSCPTGALQFKGSVYWPDPAKPETKRDPWADEPLTPKPQTVPAEVLEKHPLYAGVPYSFLKWNEGAVGELKPEAGAILCTQGEYGSTAFQILEGAIEVLVGPNKVQVATLQPKDVIVGEMAVMAHEPRTATLRVAQGGARLWVIKRNMLHMLQRNRAAREVLRPIYRTRALSSYLRSGLLFAQILTDEQNGLCSKFLAERKDVRYVQVDPGQAVFLQNNEADSFYVIAKGHVTVEEKKPSGHVIVQNYLGRGRSFGEIGLLSRLYDEVGEAVEAKWPGKRGRRTQTCAALDHVELVKVSGEAFAELLERNPEIKNKVIAKALELLRTPPPAVGNDMTAFVEKNVALYQGQKLMVLDLNRCTRCQECVKACADSHHGVTRLVLEGNRFGKYLVPSACRSCYDPACLTGCPVDAIHRRPADTSRGARSLAIFIEDHCIGCGLCANNCPFGSIHMLRKEDAPGSFGWVYQGARAATNCDLCESLDGDPRCVKRCPHEAAIRETGVKFASRVDLKPLGSAT